MCVDDGCFHLLGRVIDIIQCGDNGPGALFVGNNLLGNDSNHADVLIDIMFSHKVDDLLEGRHTSHRVEHHMCGIAELPEAAVHR